MAEYTLDDLFEDTFIELGGKKYKLRQRTRSLGAKFDGYEERWLKIQDGDDTTPDDLADALIDMLDLVLEPLGDGNNGTRTHAKTVLSKAWKNEEIGLDRLSGLLSFCQDKMLAGLDPTTSTTTTDD